MPNRSARRKPLPQWENRREEIVDLYANQTLDQLMSTLKDKYNFTVTKRQLVYRLGLWGCKKYNKAEEDDSTGLVSTYQEDCSDNDRNDADCYAGVWSPMQQGYSGNASSEPPVTSSVLANLRHIAVGNVHRSLSRRNEMRRDADYRRLTTLLIQHICESIATGSVFVDLADPLKKGFRLFKWAADTDKSIDTIRASRGLANATPPPINIQLHALEEIIMDEHPHLLGTLFKIWEHLAHINDGEETGKAFISTVSRLSRRLLGGRHFISHIFDCLDAGSFEPARCLECLGVLPSELFAQHNPGAEPSFERHETSDYQSMASLIYEPDQQQHLSGHLFASKPGIERGDSRISHGPVYLGTENSQTEQKSRPLPPLFPWADSSSRLAQQAEAHDSKPPMRGETKSQPTCDGLYPRSFSPAYTLALEDRVRQLEAEKEGHAISRTDQSPASLYLHYSHQFGNSSTDTVQASSCGVVCSHNPKPLPILPETLAEAPLAGNGNALSVDKNCTSWDEGSDTASYLTAYDELEAQPIQEEKKKIVNSIMDSFLQDLDSYLESLTDSFSNVKLEDTGEFKETLEDNQDTAARSQARGGRKKARLSSGMGTSDGDKGKGRADDSDRGDENDDEEDDNKRNRKKPMQPDCREQVSFACPYYKWNTQKYKRRRVCAGPGWPSPHRVKDHLYRCHQKPLYECSRCRSDLKGESALNSHLNQEPMCERRLLQEPCDKFGTEKERLLRIRPKGRKSEAERWREIYRILFDVRDDDIPTPYYDLDRSVLDREETWDEFARREVVPLLREQFEIEVTRALADIAPTILSRVRGVIRNLEVPLRRNFQRSQKQARLPAEDSPTLQETPTSDIEEPYVPQAPHSQPVSMAPPVWFAINHSSDNVGQRTLAHREPQQSYEATSPGASSFEMPPLSADDPGSHAQMFEDLYQVPPEYSIPESDWDFDLIPWNGWDDGARGHDGA